MKIYSDASLSADQVTAIAKQAASEVHQAVTSNLSEVDAQQNKRIDRVYRVIAAVSIFNAVIIAAGYMFR